MPIKILVVEDDPSEIKEIIKVLKNNAWSNNERPKQVKNIYDSNLKNILEISEYLKTNNDDIIILIEKPSEIIVKEAVKQLKPDLIILDLARIIHKQRARHP